MVYEHQIPALNRCTYHTDDTSWILRFHEYGMNEYEKIIYRTAKLIFRCITEWL